MQRPMIGDIVHDLDDRVIVACIVVVVHDGADDAILSPTGARCGAGSLHD